MAGVNRACPALLVLLAVGLSAGCTISRTHYSSQPLQARVVEPRYYGGSAFSEAREESQRAYIKTRSKELLRQGTFDTKRAARDYALYEWSQQYNTARALSGEGFQTASVPIRSPKRVRKEQQLRRDLADLDLLRP